MRVPGDRIHIQAYSAAAMRAASLLKTELAERLPGFRNTANADEFTLMFSVSPELGKEQYRIACGPRSLTVYAASLRGFIYAVGRFLRKCEFRNGDVLIPETLPGFFSPDKTIRGHQLGYRHCANTYDAWNKADFRRYSLELMYFGMNTVEHIPKTNDDPPAPLMKHDENELLREVSLDADALDLDVSLWIPNDTADLAASLKKRKEIFENTPRINAVFIPGSDPGDLPAGDLKTHCLAIARLLHETHPDAKLWVSAQAPHNAPGWGESFLEQFSSVPEQEVAGVITGPNHAFDPDTLRRRLPSGIPVRFYPDITHNVRCEYPVHFQEDDWHYAYAAALSRECINPRPMEYHKLHRIFARYTVGSVSYSEGVNDDVNKALWSALEWDGDADVHEILSDYARLFFCGADTETAVSAILGLELNWNAPPDLNPQIDATLALWEALGEQTPALRRNWRYLQGLFRARCDAYIRQKFLFETALLREASARFRAGNLTQAEKILHTDLPADLLRRRNELEITADRLNETVGMQLSVSKHGASGWERGATLDTIDNPITDLEYLKYQFVRSRKQANPREYMLKILNRNHVRADEYYFSFALHGLSVLGCKQTGEFYMDFQGDKRAVNNGTLPVCLQKCYDHLSFHCKLGGFTPGQDYVLTLTYKNAPDQNTAEHRITANGHTVYLGPQFGGSPAGGILPATLPEGFTAVSYPLPAAVFENGCLALEITEPTRGFEIAEFFIKKQEAPVHA